MQERVDVGDFAPIVGRTSLFGNHLPTETSRRVASYFETSGFSRWTAIYGDGGIPPIWRVIREGHERAMNQVVAWVRADGHRTALDAGCGTGSLALRLADCGYEVDGFDVSASMVSFARYISKDRTRGIQPHFHTGDIAALEAAGRSYDLVCCLDVLFHYPIEEVREMLTRLAEVSAHKIVASFALKTSWNSLWMFVGRNFFHRKNRMTNLHLLSYDDVERTVYRAGFRVTRKVRIKRFFYDSFVFEAVRA